MAEEEEEEEESHAKWEMDLTALFPLLVWESVNLGGNNILIWVADSLEVYPGCFSLSNVETRTCGRKSWHLLLIASQTPFPSFSCCTKKERRGKGIPPPFPVAKSRTLDSTEKNVLFSHL